MFDYLAVIEKKFNNTLPNIDRKESYLACRKHIAKQLFVPFSSESFGKYDILLTALNFDLSAIFFNFSIFSIDLGSTAPYWIMIPILEILSPIVILIGALDLCFNLTMFALSLLTRSLASLYYMTTHTPHQENTSEYNPLDLNNKYPINRII